MTRRYVERLGVPLFVWCVGRDADPAWGACQDVATAGKLNAAARDLAAALERQRIVWIEGTLLPHSVALTSRAAAVSLAR